MHESATFILGIFAGVAVTIVLGYLNSNFLSTSKKISLLESQFRISSSKLSEIIKQFLVELEKGLSVNGATLKCLPSYVTKLPTGKETGKYLALDLGGTNLRVCEVHLLGDGKFKIRQEKYTISEHLKKSSELFLFIAKSVKRALVEWKSDATKLGFTFSFPVNQTALNKGSLLHWNKGFDIPNTVGVDVVDLLNKALDSEGVKIDVVAIVNDTVGTLVSHAYVNTSTKIGAILGTGTNGCYIENTDRIRKLGSTHDESMIINVEWGAFDNERRVIRSTPYDYILDNESENKGGQIFEKMVSGMYLGEITRLIILDLIETNELFQKSCIKSFQKPFSFETQFMSRIERDHSLDLHDTSALLEDHFSLKSSLADRRTIKRICELVGIRSARLAAAAVAALVIKTDSLENVTVAIDGSVFEHYPHYRNRIYDALREVFGDVDGIKLELASDGSGIGAALIAAVMPD